MTHDYRLCKNPIHLASFGFGAGLSPKAPGTVGTLMALPLWYGLQFLPLPVYSLIVLLAFGFGVFCCGYTARAMGVHDHGGIVWDEFVGLWIALWAVPAEPLWMLAGFVLFRLFDIAKPWPIKWLDRQVHGGFGIMIDDVLAGFFAALILHWALYAL